MASPRNKEKPIRIHICEFVHANTLVRLHICKSTYVNLLYNIMYVNLYNLRIRVIQIISSSIVNEGYFHGHETGPLRSASMESSPIKRVSTENEACEAPIHGNRRTIQSVLIAFKIENRLFSFVMFSNLIFIFRKCKLRKGCRMIEFII